MSQDRMQNNDSRQATPGLGGSLPTPNVANVLSKARQAQDKVRVVHGANEQYFDNLSGKTVGKIRKSLREVFNIPGDAVALVDGKEVGDDFVLSGGQHLEFNKEAGTKGGGRFNIYTWTTLVFFVLMLASGLHTVWNFITLHPVRASFGFLTTLVWALLFKINLDRFNSVERSSDL